MPTVFAVFAEQTFPGHISTFVFIADTAKIFFFGFGKFIGVNKSIVSCVVWRIDVNHLELTEIRFLQNLQNLKIFALDENIFGIVKINRPFFPAQALQSLVIATHEKHLISLPSLKHSVRF